MITYSNIESINELFLNLEIRSLYTNYNSNHNFPLTFDRYISSNDNNEIKYLIHSKNQNLLVIQEMGVAFFLSDYLIKKLPFYQVLFNNDSNFTKDYFYINTDNYTKNIELEPNSGCKVLLITGQWNINQWSINKLISLHEWLPYLGENTDETIPNDIKKKIDYKFIEALGYSINTIIDQGDFNE